MNTNPSASDLVVIGAGPGGYAAAFLAADLGMQVTLIDQGPKPGGVCLFRGCIPTKALLHVSKIITEARDAEAMGVSFGDPQIDIRKTRAWKDDVVRRLTAGLGQLSKQRKITYHQGTARFTDPQTVEVQGDSGMRRMSFGHAIVATGATPAKLPDVSLESQRVMDSTLALELADVPQSLLVVGGGYIGLEIGTIYATLGPRVTVVEMTPGLLPGTDRDLVAVLEKRIAGLFESIMVETSVAGMTETSDGVRCVFEGSRVETGEREYDKVLVAIGRRPNTAELGLEHTSVEVDDRGFIRVDGMRRTGQPTISAIGDVAGGPMLAHKAAHEGRAAVEAIAGSKVTFDPHAIPAVEYTDPEIAWTGLTETQAAEQNRRVRVARFPWAASGRAATLGRSDGLTKLIVDPDTERVLGVGIVGVGAGELIAEGTLAIEMAALASDIALTIHPHPTLSETLMEAADVYYDRSTHIYRRKKGGGGAEK